MATPTIPHPHATWRDYYELGKPRVVMLIMFTAIAGMFLAAPGFPPPNALVFGTLGIALAASAAAAVNHVLDHPARVAIHFVHRLGALVTALVLGFLSFAAIRSGPTRAVRSAGMVLAAVLVCQLILGPAMVIRALPLALATAHNAVAALLLLAVVALNRQLRAT